VKVLACDAKATLGITPNLQVAFASVLTIRSVLVVPTGSVPTGTTREITGGTVLAALLTTTSTAADVVVRPAASRAVAVIAYESSITEVEFQIIEYGAVASSLPILFPFNLNWTPATPTLSLAVAVMLTLDPETIAPSAGDVMETVGGVVSTTASDRVGINAKHATINNATVTNLLIATHNFFNIFYRDCFNV
jgi:hypothetical protein